MIACSQCRYRYHISCANIPENARNGNVLWLGPCCRSSSAAIRARRQKRIATTMSTSAAGRAATSNTSVMKALEQTVSIRQSSRKKRPCCRLTDFDVTAICTSMLKKNDRVTPTSYARVSDNGQADSNIKQQKGTSLHWPMKSRGQKTRTSLKVMYNTAFTSEIFTTSTQQNSGQLNRFKDKCLPDVSFIKYLL